MKVIKKVFRSAMEKQLQEDAKVKYASCDQDCPKCRVSDG